MNYRHAFHAGNFADVLKHAVLGRILLHLRRKPTAFRVIDTHAGAGLYDLASEEATRSGEWRDGIARLCAATLDARAQSLLAPYLDAVLACRRGAALVCYPGSPLIAHTLMRPQDRLIACEIMPEAVAALARVLGRDPRCKVLRLDGWLALGAQVPPKERRGLVLIDPPYEQAEDFIRLRDGLLAAHRKWATGIYLAWYPIKDRTGPDLLVAGLRRAAVGKALRIELAVAAEPAQRLVRCGVIAINPPWTLADDLARLLPVLAQVLAPEGGGSFRLDWLDVAG
jgi:23S rRNA (adenine2030-N6)-methyltransferase